MPVIVKKVLDALGNQFDVGFNLDDNIYYPVGSPKTAGIIPTPFFRYADTNGNGTGTYDMIGDYSGGGLEIAYVQPGAGEVLRIARMVVYIRDGKGMSSSTYGQMAALTVGVQVRVQNDSGTLINLTSQEKVQTNGGWASYCYDTNVLVWGAGDDVLAVRWTFDKTGMPLRLVGDNNERLEIVLNDSMTGLVHQAFHIQGYYE